MPRKSSVSTADAEVRALIDELLADGGYTLDDVKQALREQLPGREHPSRSSIGRYKQTIDRLGERMRRAREISSIWADKISKEPKSDTAQGVIQLLSTLAFESAEARFDDDSGTADPEELATLTLVMQRLTRAAQNDLALKKQLRESMAAEVEAKLQSAPRKLDADALELVRSALRGKE